ncbi:hypothetical protein PGTUg99_009783 [Puccinia graminis f. sp. tritici]|uniref:Uncharacterized protein n=1 Tax=Puccinia graminis f. sp. tritici TaxID=56615 RepID=A0A5B0QYU0_PUCGR|nr:hypothetical protein PGTUg99_009783 [Puccinia graminis f. sp. tritici]
MALAYKTLPSEAAGFPSSFPNVTSWKKDVQPTWLTDHHTIPMMAATNNSCDGNVERLTHYDHASFEALALNPSSSSWNWCFELADRHPPNIAGESEQRVLNTNPTSFKAGYIS